MDGCQAVGCGMVRCGMVGCGRLGVGGWVWEVGTKSCIRMDLVQLLKNGLRQNEKSDGKCPNLRQELGHLMKKIGRMANMK